MDMWQEFPLDTRLWSEDDWEHYFDQEDRKGRHALAEPVEESEGSQYSPSIDGQLDDSCSADGMPLQEGPEQDVEPDIGELNAIPAWRAAVDLTENIYRFVAPACEEARGGPVQYIARTLCREGCNVHDCLEVGHKLGYEEDTLCGNIAMCRRSYRALQRCIQCLERLGGNGDPECGRLLTRALVTRSFLQRRMSEMREMVWWR
jgi:hypothetical protein